MKKKNQLLERVLKCKSVCLKDTLVVNLLISYTLPVPKLSSQNVGDFKEIKFPCGTGTVLCNTGFLQKQDTPIKQFYPLFRHFD